MFSYIQRSNSYLIVKDLRKLTCICIPISDFVPALSRPGRGCWWRPSAAPHVTGTVRDESAIKKTITFVRLKLEALKLVSSLPHKDHLRLELTTSVIYQKVANLYFDHTACVLLNFRNETLSLKIKIACMDESRKLKISPKTLDAYAALRCSLFTTQYISCCATRLFRRFFPQAVRSLKSSSTFQNKKQSSKERKEERKKKTK